MYNYRFIINMIIAYAICLLAIICSSCSYKQNQVLFEGKTARDTSMAYAVVPVYKIESQDILQIRNLQNINYVVENASPSGSNSSSISSQPQNYQVEENGNVALPVIGRVKVAGLSQMEAEKKIEDLYGNTVLKDPIIELKIVSLKVTLLGEVKTPGNYPLVSDKTNLVDLLGQAGGFTEKADEKEIKIIRGGVLNPQITMIDLSNLKAVSNPDIILQNHDIIYVSQNKRAIRNDKFQTFSTIIQPALLLLNTALIIFTLTKK